MPLSLKYFSVHPLVTPELYTSTSVVRSLYVSHSLQYEPYIIADTFQNATSVIFNDPYEVFHPHISFHILYSPLENLKYRNHNYVATQFVRQHFMTSVGKHTMDSIYGDILIFGSFNFSKLSFDDTHSSVPYEVIEQVERIYSVVSPIQ